MSLVGKLSLRGKFILLLLLPLLALVVLGMQIIFSQHTLSQRMADFRLLSGLAVRASAVVHEAQKERGLSAGFLGSQGRSFKHELIKQRQETNQRVVLYQQYLKTLPMANFGPLLGQALNEANGQLDKIDDIRRRIDGLDIPPMEAIGYYTKVNLGLLDLVEQMTKLAANVEMAANISAYVSLLQAKERAGQERATGNNTFAQDKFGPGMLVKFITLIAEQDTYARAFQAHAAPAQVEYYRARLTGAAVEEVARMRQQALLKAQEGQFGIDPAHWFQTISTKINLLKEVEDRLAGDLDQQAARLYDDAAQMLWLLLAGLGLGLAVVVALATFIVREILRQIGGEPARVMAITQQVASGDLTVVFDGSGHTGIYHALQAMVESFGSIIKTVFLQTNTLGACVRELAQGKATLIEDVAAGNGHARRLMEENRNLQADLTAITQAAETTDQNIQVMVAANEELSATIAAIAGVAKQASGNATTMAAAATQMNANLAAVNDNLEQVNGSVSTVAAAVTQMDGVIEEVRQRCDTATQETNKATSHTQHTLRVMEQLGGSAQEIGQVVDVIKNIAEQTNMLALNAAIEAAGAGEAGKGFAVVANEVKELARQTANATDMIAQRIEEIRSQAEGAAAAADDIATAMTAINRANGEITHAVDEQAKSTRSIATAMTGVAQAAQEVTRNAQELETTSGEVARSAEELAGGAGEIARATQEASSTARDITDRGHEVRRMVNNTLTAVSTAGDALTTVRATLDETFRTISFISGAAHHTALLVDVVHETEESLTQAARRFTINAEPFAVGAIKEAHLGWLRKLENVIRGRTQLSPNQVASGHDCDFGKWYDSAGMDHYGKLPLFQELGKVHMSVHETAREVVKSVDAGHNEAALAGMDQFNRIRRDLFERLDQLYLEVYDQP